MDALAPRALAVLLLAAVCPARSALATIVVVPDQRPSIQLAIDACADGDTVLVRAGTYVENIDMSGRVIAVMSEDGPAVTTIDGSDPDDPCAGMAVLMSGLEGARLEGFTITGGSGWGGTECTGPDDPRFGGGVFVRWGGSTVWGATVRNNWITGNVLTGTGDGGGMYVQGAARVDSNRVFANIVHDGMLGGGIVVRPAGTNWVVVEANEIFDNRITNQDPTSAAFGGGLEALGSVDIMSNIIACNWADRGGGMTTSGSFTGSNMVMGNTIVANLVNGAGSGAAGVTLTDHGTLVFANNSVYSNIGTGVRCWAAPEQFRCNNVWGNFPDFQHADPCEDRIGLDGNFSADPLYGSVSCAPGPRDYCLEADSPQLPENTAPDCGLVGARGPCPPIGIHDAAAPAPRPLRVLPARPNPFAERTAIPFHLDEAGEIEIHIYDVLGRQLRSLSDGWRFAGEHVVEWDGRDAQGRPAPSGAYVARIRSGRREITRSLLLVR